MEDLVYDEEDLFYDVIDTTKRRLKAKSTLRNRQKRKLSDDSNSRRHVFVKMKERLLGY